MARRTGDRETELWATSLRWVALLELGDPRYQRGAHHLRRARTGTATSPAPDFGGHRQRDHRGVPGRLRRGRRAGSPSSATSTDPGHAEFGVHGPPPALVPAAAPGPVRRGRRPAGRAGPDRLPLPGAAAGDHRRRARRRRDGGPADRRHRGRRRSATRARCRRSGYGYARRPPPRPPTRSAATPHGPRSPRTGESGWWRSSAATSAARSTTGWHWSTPPQQRWDDAIAGFTAARESADRLGARTWSLIARAGLVDALAGRGHPGDAATLAALRATTAQQAAAWA